MLYLKVFLNLNKTFTKNLNITTATIYISSCLPYQFTTRIFRKLFRIGIFLVNYYYTHGL